MFSQSGRTVDSIVNSYGTWRKYGITIQTPSIIRVSDVRDSAKKQLLGKPQ